MEFMEIFLKEELMGGDKLDDILARVSFFWVTTNYC